MAAATPRHQRILQIDQGGTRIVVRGPELEQGRKQSFKRYSNRIPSWRDYTRLPRSNTNRIRPNVAGRRRTQRQTISGYTPFKSVTNLADSSPAQRREALSKPWLTTYQYREPGPTGRNETIVFHIHTAPPAADVPAPAPQTFLQWIGITAGAANAPPAASIWQRIQTRKQFAPAPTTDDTGLGLQRSLVLNERGAIFRSASDILYLDKTFWNLYFQDYQVAVDILTAGVYPRELSHIRRLAVDIAVLRNRDEFAAVAKAIKFHLPNATSFLG